jgi:predicted acylesterase/phospholipase RssA
VDVSPERDLSMPRDYFGRPGALEVIGSHLGFGRSHGEQGYAPGEGAHHGFPTLADVLLRAMLLSSIHQRSEVKNLADIYINPPIGDFKMLDWKRIDELIEIGYRVGMERLKPLADTRQKAGV